MKAKWKKLLLWSSLGSLAFGATVAAIRRARRKPESALVCTQIPPDCAKVELWTERFKVEEKGKEWQVHDRYLFQATHFKVWSVLDLGSSARAGARGGAPIYHVTHMRLREVENRMEEEKHLLGRFYGTVGVLDAEGKYYGPSTVARGGTIEIRKCYVGGASNGVESGEVHHSSGRVLNYRFEYALVEA